MTGRYRHIIWLFFLLCSVSVWGQVAPISETPVAAHEVGLKADTTVNDHEDLKNSKDSVATDTADIDTTASGSSTQQRLPQKKSELKAPIHYEAKDSMVMMRDGTAYLHGSGDLKYENMELSSEYIRVNMDSSQIYAQGVYDSLNNEWKGRPVFKDGKDEYQTNEITYNIKTQKGYIRHVVTQQGEGYIIADRTKKVGDDVLMMAGGQYTTCDDHEHPHFYLKLTKAKVKPGEYIAAGPAYLVVGDVPLPLAVPFGFFPFTDSYSSGLIMPNFGDDYSRGLYLQGLGYYFALCDYMDLQVTGDIYTRGTWSIKAESKYVWRYHFSGNLNISYRNDVTSEKGMPDYGVNKNFSINWTHSQDAKFNPYSTFSANVNFSTSGYDRSNINSYYNPNLYSQNTKSSTINYTQRFPDSPWSMSMTASLSQSTRDSTLSLTAPELAVSMSSIYPFKIARDAALKRSGKVRSGKEKWYEKIKLSYTMNGKIAVNNIKEDKLKHSDFLRDWQTGIKHSIPINASFMLFKYISITPSINMTDRMYFTRVDRSWDNEQQQLRMDTTNGFYNVFDFNAGISMSTKIYGFFTPIKKLFPKGNVDKFRWVITPRASFSYHPDFEDNFWGYYGKYEEPVYYKDSLDANGMKVPTGATIQQVYSRYPTGIYGMPGRGMSATLSFGFDNNLEMKVVNKKDTTGKNPFKVISLIDNFGISGGYNVAADSMNWSNFQVNLRLKFPKLNNYSLNMNTSLDPYMYEKNEAGVIRRTNKQYWNYGRFPLWNGLRWSFSYTISDQTIKKWKEDAAKRRGEKVNSSEGTNTDGANGDETANIDAIEKGDDGLDKNAKLNNSRGKSEAKVDDGYVQTEFPWSISINYSLAYAPGGKFYSDSSIYIGPDASLHGTKIEHYYPYFEWTNNLSVSGNIGLGKGWKVSASMSYDFTHKVVSSCTFNVSRDLHCWNMTASINPIGPYKSYTFHIGVNASMLKDLKYDKNSSQSTNARVEWW
ncbi:MAG: LPS-assembly protein LptD [Paludibacteraceae bacterium]|nr:LPS-assembly protein LptD [Paludibacteraceae bacterium]